MQDGFQLRFPIFITEKENQSNYSMNILMFAAQQFSFWYLRFGIKV